MGNSALDSNTTGSNCVAVGFSALLENTTGGSNVAVGRLSLDACTTGSNNVAVGTSALTDLSDQSSCTAIGVLAGENAVGTQNVFVGFQAGQGATSGCNGQDNVAVGKDALLVMTTASNNTIVGREAGSNLTTGSNNLFLGKRAGTASSPSGIQQTGSNVVCLGDNSISSLFCADTSISSSDSRDKTDVTSFNVGLAWIEALRPVTYRWDRRTWYGTDAEPFGTPDGSKKRQKLHIGFLAQEALEVEKANGYGSSNDNSLIVNLTDDGMSYGMKYERLVPILVNAIKELSVKVTALEAG